MGVNKLNSLMKTMAERDNLDNCHLTNHSARKRMIQAWNDEDIPPIHVIQLSGHNNVQSTNNYSHVSHEKQKSMSRILSGSTSMVQTETHPLVETREHQNPTPTAAGLSININSSSSSTEGHKRQTYRRIKRIFDSSGRRRQSTFDIERVGFVEKLSTCFCRAFPPIYCVYFSNKYLRKTNVVMKLSCCKLS